MCTWPVLVYTMVLWLTLVRANQPSPVLGSPEERLADVGAGDALFLKVEYQTLRRLPTHSDHSLFTVRSFVEPLGAAVEQAPEAAAQLAYNIRHVPPDYLEYKGLGDEPIRCAVLEYLDGVAGPEVSARAPLRRRHSKRKINNKG